jgi:hypothetical protein
MARKRKTVKDYLQSGQKMGRRKMVETNVKRSIGSIRPSKKKH